MEIANYFDNAATTPVDPRVAEAMRPFFEQDFGNANSIHSWGIAAHAAVEDSRGRIAGLVGAADPTQILFTSGATESNNWVLAHRDSIAVSPFEHSAVLEPARKLGADILPKPGARFGTASATVDLMSVMSVNNEIGARLDVPKGAKTSANAVHRDITQEVGKFRVDLEDVDFASFSAHKFYGPKGVGCLYAENPFGLEPLIMGGEQQHGLRGGTLNVPGIVGMGVAASIAIERMAEEAEHMEACRAAVLKEVEGLSDFAVHGGPRSSPYILSMSFSGVEGEALVLDLDRRGYAISGGAACSSRSTDPSHVLLALEVPSELLRGTIRISFGRFNTKESALRLGRALRGAVDTLRNLRTI